MLGSMLIGSVSSEQAPRFVTRGDYEIVPPGEEIYVDSPRFIADSAYVPQDASSIHWPHWLDLGRRS